MTGDARSEGHRNGAAILESLAKITEGDTHYVLRIPIMNGERTGLKNSAKKSALKGHLEQI